MATKQHKIGDRVIIKPYVWYDKNRKGWGDITIRLENGESEAFIYDMSFLCGHIAYITGITPSGYLIDIDEVGYYWHDEFFVGGTDETIVYP